MTRGRKLLLASGIAAVLSCAARPDQEPATEHPAAEATDSASATQVPDTTDRIQPGELAWFRFTDALRQRLPRFFVAGDDFNVESGFAFHAI